MPETRPTNANELPTPALDLAGKPPSARTRSRERFEARRERVIDASAALFAKQGFHATSIDELCQATGLKRGGLYYYMAGKKDLLFQIHERFITPLLENAREIAARGEPPELELRLLARALMQDIADYRDGVTVFLHEWRMIADEPQWERVRHARREFEGIIASCLRRGTRTGAFRALDERTTMRGFLGMINYTYQWLDPAGTMSPDAVADLFADIVLHGIVTDERELG